MKKVLFFIGLCLIATISFANHITGGTIYYDLVSQSGNNYTYQVTLKLYRDSASTGAPLDAMAPISIFDNGTGQNVSNNSVPRSLVENLSLRFPNPCISNPPPIRYQVGYYVFTVTLSGNISGYTIVYQRCCRIQGINNLAAPSSSVGATFSAIIPGTVPVATGPANNSAQFTGADTVIVCAYNNFCYDFSATDVPDLVNNIRDSLAYSFCTAFTGGSTGNASPNPPAAPPYSGVPYLDPYGPSSPLGPTVNINPVTGQMCGTAPAPGIYVVTVCVTEYRNGVAIATQRKDLQIKVGDCNVADADLKPEYVTCDGFTYTFSNEAPASPLITSYYWDFGDGNTSSLQQPTHTYADTGTYNFKLVINRNGSCSDSALSKIKVYPGFFPGFTFSGFCATKPTQFTDTTNTRYGFVNTWRWNFGDNATLADTSRLQNPTYTYPIQGSKTVTFIVTSSKGCIDTVIKDISILDRPPLTLLTKDTLMCNGDTTQLGAIGSGIFTWTPASNIINANTATPLVYPTTTTNYFVELNDNGCIALDTVRVRVVNTVTLQAMPDTTICFADSARLRAGGNGLRYIWSPAAAFRNPTSQNQFVTPVLSSTTYTVRSFIGRCVATDDVTVTTVPYPVASAGADATVCFQTPAQLNASIVGASFTWSPTASLSNPNILNPIASPTNTTSYVLTVFDTRGCPKPGRDTVTVTVLPEVFAFAGNDTSVVINQPLQFNATGGVSYLWTPGTSLNRNNIFNPIGIYNGDIDSITYRVVVMDAAGCADEDDIRVKVFRTSPQIFVPSAFTPNGDGKNDLIRPIAVGITKIDYFRVFNRWGQLVFATTTNEDGWDGKIKGIPQGSNTYVWIVRGVDYTGKVVVGKGTVTLIR